MIAPSTQKIVYAPRLGEFWSGKGDDGGHGFRMVVIGYSLPAQEEYARQVIYRILTNYQDIPAERIDQRRQKELLMIVDLCQSPAAEAAFRERYRFVDWERANTLFGWL